MDIEFFVIVKTSISTVTGLPFVWGKGGYEINYAYDPKQYVVPERYRRWLYVRNPVLEVYLQNCNPNDRDSVSIEYFQRVFPSWETVEQQVYLNGYDWYPFDHDNFKKAIDWLVEQKVFGIEWSLNIIR
jgi:hypothetical protein